MNTPDPESGTELLAATLRDPFDSGKTLPWFDYLQRTFPLWSFQPWAYRARRIATEAGSHPLQLLVASVLRDDGGEARRGPLAPLPKMVDEIRRGIAHGDAELAASATSRFERGGPASFGGAPDLSLGRPRTAADDAADARGLPSSPEEIGLRLVELVGRRAEARDPADRGAATRALEEFLSGIEAGLGREAPAVTEPESLLRGLYREGQELLRLCWNAVPFEVSPQAASRIERLRTSSEQKPDTWCARLALPVLSRPEVLALRSESGASRFSQLGGRGGAAPHYAVWVLARRLGLNPGTLAEEALEQRDAEFFRRLGANPIERFVQP